MKTVTTIILAHYKERESNLKRIIDDLLEGTVVPKKVIVFIDTPDITFTDERVTTIKSDTPFLPIIRFALGITCDTDYCFFLDDDLTVQEKTLENFITYASIYSRSILGLEGSILGKTETPYSNDIPVKRGNSAKLVDIIIRTYFVPTDVLMAGFRIIHMFPQLPVQSMDDVFLCLGNKYLNDGDNYVIPVDEKTNVVELPDGGVGQSLHENHYGNRNMVCRFLMNIYE